VRAIAKGRHRARNSVTTRALDDTSSAAAVTADAVAIVARLAVLNNAVAAYFKSTSRIAPIAILRIIVVALFAVIQHAITA
jgi:hypothetical protein